MPSGFKDCSKTLARPGSFIHSGSAENEKSGIDGRLQSEAPDRVCPLAEKKQRFGHELTAIRSARVLLE